eukprot:Em0008g603a
MAVMLGSTSCDAASEYNCKMQDYRTSEFSHMAGATYLDHTGTTLYAKSHLEACFKDLASNLYGNPHSHNPSSTNSSDRIHHVRETILRHFNTTLNQYSIVFTSGCTGALKLLGESFPFSSGSESPSPHTKYVWYQGSGCTETAFWSPGQSVFCYLDDNHTSVVGVREVAAHRGAALVCMTKSGLKPSPTSRDGGPSEPQPEPFCGHGRDAIGSSTAAEKEGPTSNQASGGSCNDKASYANTFFHLFAYPAQSNFSGYKYPLSWLNDLPKGRVCLDGLEGVGGTWLTLLDAAAFVPTNPLDLTTHPAHFVTLSFYKMFGFPTGLGALLVRKDVEHLLHKIYYGGGTVMALISREYFHAPKSLLHERMEDGTLSFLDIIALEHGFKVFYRLVGSMEDARSHTCSLARHVYNFLKSCQHSNGSPVCIVYSDSDYGDPHSQGGTISVNFLRPTGEFVGYAEVDRMASARNIHVRTGCFCNSSACMKFIGLTGKTIMDNLKAGHVCGDDMDMVNGAPIGCIRVSFGYMSTLDDALKFMEFVKQCLVDNSCSVKSQETKDQCVMGQEQIQSMKQCALAEVDDTLKREVKDLKKQIADLTESVKLLAGKHQEENAFQHQLSGVLWKKGTKWPKRDVWKSRFFRMEDFGRSRIAYYRHRDDLLPAGYIEMDKITNISMAVSAQQDKNHATFQIECEGQMHQLRAQNEAEMRRWVETIHSILETRKNQSTSA